MTKFTVMLEPLHSAVGHKFLAETFRRDENGDLTFFNENELPIRIYARGSWAIVKVNSDGPEQDNQF